jgi:very-short-patch-repair endonuclease
MGARLFVIGFIKDPATGFPMSIVYRKGRVLRDAKMQRELRIGKCSVDFGNDIGWVIEVDGSAWHQDVVADFDREVYLRDYLRRQKLDLHLLRIKAPRLWNDRTAVQREVLKFLSD